MKIIIKTLKINKSSSYKFVFPCFNFNILYINVGLLDAVVELRLFEPQSTEFKSWIAWIFT